MYEMWLMTAEVLVYLQEHNMHSQCDGLCMHAEYLHACRVSARYGTYGDSHL